MKKSFKNIVFGIGGQIITIALGIILPRLFITTYGSEVNGMLSSVNNIFSYIALLEAGIGTATLQALYGPVAKSKHDDINGILSATNLFFKRTGLFYLIAVLLFAAVYPFCVESDIPNYVVASVILLIGLTNVINFFFQGKYKLLLQAEGKQYIITNVTTIVHIFVSVSKIVLIFLGQSVVTITFAQFLLNIAQMLYYAIYIKRKYKWLNVKATPNKAAISQSKNVVVHQVAQLVFNNTDTIVLSFFCGYKVASIYALFNLFFEMISTLLSHINSGFIYKMGQLCNSDREQYKKMYEPWEQYTMAISFALYCITFIFIVPFIKVYTNNTDINYLEYTWLPVLFVIIKLLVSGRATAGHSASFAGHFKQTQWRSVCETIINIVVSLVGVIILNTYGIGIYGVLLGTVVALLYRSNDMIIYNCRHIIDRSSWKTYKRWIIDIGLFFLLAWISNYIPMDLSSYISIILWCIPVAVIVIAVYFGVALISEPRTSRIVINLVKSVFSRKKHK